MWKPLWIVIALGLIVVAGESVVDNEKVVDDTLDAIGNQKMDMNIPGIDKELPSPEEFLKMLDSMSNLSDDEKDNIREYLLKNPGNFNNMMPPEENSFWYQILRLLGLLAVIGVVFVFFGYKLYKSLVERDIRREMKKKQKELKKKK